MSMSLVKELAAKSGLDKSLLHTVSIVPLYEHNIGHFK